MNSDAFSETLSRLGLGPTEFCRAIKRLSGRQMSLRTVHGWLLDSGRMSAMDWALLAMMERHPEEWRVPPVPPPQIAGVPAPA